MPKPPPLELDPVHIREFGPDGFEPFKERDMNYSYSGMFGPAGANPQTRELMHETQVAVEQEFNARTASIPQTTEVELAATRLEGPTNPLPPAAALAREVGVRNTLIQRKSAEFQRQTAIANRFYGSDPLGKTFKDYLNQASANRRAQGAAVRSRALWSESFRAAHEARLLGQTLALLNQQQAGVLNWLATVQAQDQAQAAAAEAQRQAAERARIAAEQQRQRDIAEAMRREQVAQTDAEQKRQMAVAEAKRQRIRARIQQAARTEARRLESEQARLAARAAQRQQAAERAQLEALAEAQRQRENLQAEREKQSRDQRVETPETQREFPASGAQATTGPAFSFASVAAVLSPEKSSSILAALRTALHTLEAGGPALLSSPALVGFAALLMPSRLGNGERFVVSVPLAELSSEPAGALREIADQRGIFEMHIGLGARQIDAGVQIFVATNDDFHIRSSIPVLNAAYDSLNDVYEVALPDSPTDFLTWTPAISPQDSSTELPIFGKRPSAYSGAPILPLEGRLDLNPILVEGWERFIIVFPDDSGIAPLYVVFSNPYEGASVRGKYSGRYFNPEAAGGAILDLDWRTAVITKSGIDLVKLHIGRLDQSDANDIMIQRLEKILSGHWELTDTDLRYYTHEIRELERFRAMGLSDDFKPENGSPAWNNAHTATLEDFKLGSEDHVLYSPDALRAGNKQMQRIYEQLLKGTGQ